MKKDVLVLFGGESAEHEVSVVTGLQVVEKIDRERYDVLSVYVSKKGELFLMPDLKTRKEFTSARRVPIAFGKDADGGFVSTLGVLKKKYYPYAAYMAFHGGTGESGPFQGLFETVGIPFTSTGQESAAIVMNKKITKDVVHDAGITVVLGVSLFSRDIRADAEATVQKVIATVSLPVIVKPVHLGSSIAIHIARTEVELQKFLLEAAHVDSEILVEQLLTNFTELNCSVRIVNDTLEVSPVERPIQHDELLSFADKYQRGGKNKAAGMASLDRDLPAKIPEPLRDRVQSAARVAYTACRMKGTPRIDFMYTESDDTLYLTEINPIPGSVAFYLWEAAGVSFKQQITDAIEQAVRDADEVGGRALDYQSDIIEKFVNQ